MRLEDLTEIQLDAMRELGNVGAGHAATALSQLLGTPVGLEVPLAETVPVAQVPDVFGGPETLVAAVYQRLLGDIEGGLLFLLTRDATLALVDMLRARDVGSTKTVGAEEQKLVTHAASLLASSYIAAVGRMCDLTLLPSQPAFALDMAGAILEVATVEIGLRTDVAVLLRTRFFDEDTSIDVALFFLPDPESLEVVFGRLGIV